jgi:hypothetical protein
MKLDIRAKGVRIHLQLFVGAIGAITGLIAVAHK